ncbi:Adenylylsulfate kinase [Actinopolymorpha cephalotaxi]|uniref:Adenylylsulfate kinase n=1 Tax=Actinopolymorpha cephalotaxi TaxID=504797 RepID=A0A1I2UUR1_9ACTN|nr:AAA family ATPase [Actinopolymorpha cephalotaxi]NYH86699.1 adenylylsulfate kinase-like enzyme [Actinopolymorpha cephalotaxi]SFG79517.1 Adenylylsulfate kinase [Actinopolymorpha cephalotaxi]
MVPMVPHPVSPRAPEAPDVPKVIVVTGIMAAGKSTVAQLLAERLDRSAHVRGDVFRRMIVSGSAPIVPDGGEAMDAELRLRYRISVSVADAYAEAGYTAVVQDIIIGRHLTEYVKSLATRPVGVVVLAPRPEVVERRESGRTKTGYADGWTAADLDAALRLETPRLGLWLDTSDQTPDQTVTQILDRLPETLVD